MRPTAPRWGVLEPSVDERIRTPGPWRDEPSAMPALEVRELSKSFGTVRAVDGLSLSVSPGEFVTLLGPSGSGKSTTLRMIAGFTPPTSGAVILDGREVTAVPSHRRNIGMVFQNYALFPHMTAGRNVAFPLEMRRTGRDELDSRVREAFSLVGLHGLQDRFPRQLSGGQQQRVALARALVFRPSLLLMDEPLGALDRKLREGLQLEIKRLHQRLGITVLYVTHDQEEALVMSDRIALIREGSVVQVGTGDNLYERPRSPFVAGFIGESNLFRGRLRRDGDRYLLSCNGWSMEVPPSSLAAGLGKTGGDAVVVVRPEHLGFEPAAGSDSAHHDALVRLSARFTAATRLGATARYDFELADGQTVRASLPAGTEHPAVRPGDDVTIHWRPVDCVVLPADEGGGTP